MADGQAGAPAVAQVLDEMSRDLTALPTTATQQEYVGADALRFNDLVTGGSAWTTSSKAPPGALDRPDRRCDRHHRLRHAV
jgi:hypothetical protein